MAGAGTIAGAPINAFVINEGAMVHSLSGTMRASSKAKLNATRRATVAETLSIALEGETLARIRSRIPAKGKISLLHAVNASQRHAVRGRGLLDTVAKLVAVRRRSAPGKAVIEFNDHVAVHARRAAVCTGRIKLTKAQVNSRRRQSAPGYGLVRFLYSVNLRAFAPIYAPGKIQTSETASAVRRVGLPGSDAIDFDGSTAATARRAFVGADVIAFLESIKLPHVCMIPTEEFRSMKLLEDLRELSVQADRPEILVRQDPREIAVPADIDDMNTPTFEDPS